MSELLIVFALLALGKIHGQEAVVSQVTNLQPLHVPALRRPVSNQEYRGLRTSKPPRLYTNPPRSADRDQSQVSGNGSQNVPPSTVGNTQPKRKLFVSSKLPDKVMIGDLVNNTEYNYSNDVYADISFENSRTADYVAVVKPVKRKNTVNMTTVKPASVNLDILNNGSVPNVDERSSFNGDPCPVGYAKVNGECVKADK